MDEYPKVVEPGEAMSRVRTPAGNEVNVANQFLPQNMTPVPAIEAPSEEDVQLAQSDEVEKEINRRVAAKRSRYRAQFAFAGPGGPKLRGEKTDDEYRDEVLQEMVQEKDLRATADAKKQTSDLLTKVSIAKQKMRLGARLDEADISAIRTFNEYKNKAREGAAPTSPTVEAAQAAPAKPQDRFADYKAAVDEEADAIKAKAGIEADLGRVKAKELENVLQAQQQLNEARKIQKEAQEKEYNQLMADYGEAQKDLEKNSEVDPGRFYGRVGTLGSIVAAISQALGAYASAKGGGPNFAMQIIENSINRDIQAQRDNIANKRSTLAEKRNGIAMFRQKIGDEDAAIAAEEMRQLKTAQLKLEQLSTKAQSQTAKQNANILMAQLNQKYEEKKMAFEASIQNKAAAKSVAATQVTEIANLDAALNALDALERQAIKAKRESQFPAATRYIPNTLANEYDTTQSGIIKMHLKAMNRGTMPLRPAALEEATKEFPDIGWDNEETIKKKIADKRAELQRQKNATIEGFRATGYDVENLQTRRVPLEKKTLTVDNQPVDYVKYSDSTDWEREQ